MKFPYKTALAHAKIVKKVLEPYCDRIEIAGSIRRECEMIGDIEIVCIPKIEIIANGLFKLSDYNVGCEVRSPSFIKAVNKWEKIKGEATEKYTQRILRWSPLKLDLFMTTKANWGHTFTIRTGSAEFSKKLARAWVKKGWRSKDCILTHSTTGEKKQFPEEEDVFKFLNIPFVTPDQRNL